MLILSGTSRKKSCQLVDIPITTENIRHEKHDHMHNVITPLRPSYIDLTEDESQPIVKRAVNTLITFRPDPSASFRRDNGSTTNVSMQRSGRKSMKGSFMPFPFMELPPEIRTLSTDFYSRLQNHQSNFMGPQVVMELDTGLDGENAHPQK